MTRISKRKRNADEFIDDIETLARQGCTKAEAAYRRGQSWDVIARRLYRLDRGDLVARFTANSEGRPANHATLDADTAAAAEERQHAYNQQLRDAFETARRRRGIPEEGKRAA